MTANAAAIQAASNTLGFALRDGPLNIEAKQVFDAEMAREKAGDCPDANNTYEFIYGMLLRL
jgi:hypothetical protein